jgi:hypothetical protein
VLHFHERGDFWALKFQKNFKKARCLKWEKREKKGGGKGRAIFFFLFLFFFFFFSKNFPLLFKCYPLYFLLFFSQRKEKKYGGLKKKGIVLFLKKFLFSSKKIKILRKHNHQNYGA